MRLFVSSLSNSSADQGNIFVPQGGDITEELQQFIDANVNNPIIIGLSKSTIYTIDKPLHIPSDSEIEINSTIKIADSETQLLTQDFVDNDTIAYVNDADLYFKSGQIIVMSDDDQPSQGGGDWKTRKKGRINWVKSVTSTYVELEHPLVSQLGIYKVSANAKIGQYNSALYIYEKDNIIISGSGLFDGNWDNQYGQYVVGDMWDGSWEGMDGGTSIVQRGSTNIHVSGLESKDWVLHSIGIWYGSAFGVLNYNSSYSDLILDACGEKHMAVIAYRNSTLTNIINKNGRDEGEIALYSNNADVICTNITSTNNRRHGVSLVGGVQPNMEFYDIDVNDNGLVGLYIQNSNNKNLKIDGVTGSSLNVAGSAPLSFVSSSLATLINNIVLDGCTKTATIIGFTDCSDLSLTNVSVINSNDGSTVTNAFNMVRSIDMSVTDYNINGVDTCYRDNSGNSNLVMTNGIIDNYITKIGVDNGNYILINETDNQNPL